MLNWFSTTRFHRAGGHLSVVALLMIVVLIPSATVLWLTAVAVRNERTVIRQQLIKAYRGQLDLAARQVNDHWSKVDHQAELLAADRTAAQLFQQCVKSEMADSVLVIGTDGRLEYPAPPFRAAADSMNEPAWKSANRLEFVEGDLAVAAEAYSAIAKVEPDTDAEARAWLAHARCLQKIGQPHGAITVLTEQLDQEHLRDTVDRSGRSLWLDSQLRALQLLATHSDHAAVNRQRARLREAINDYRRPFPSSQRLFAMNEMLVLFPDADPFPTRNAERLAASYAEASQGDSSPLVWTMATDAGRISVQDLTGTGCVMLKSSRVLLVYGEKTLARQTELLLHRWQTDNITISLAATQKQSQATEPAIATVSLPSMPGWGLALTLNDPNLLDDSSRQQTAMYTVASLVTIAAVAVIAIVIALVVGRQLRLAQLKNDLAAVVSHELRTPLASIRILVDTLLEDRAPGAAKQNEYLELIARENARLSRLIENFLTFSRLQRGDAQLALRDVRPQDLCARAVEVSSEKLKADRCQFEVDVAANLPTICVDEEAMVVVLLNLLDNAVKFTGDDGEIRFTATAENGAVAFHVRDNGIGMSPADARRAFDQYFQSDTRLDRRHGGCGLGLSLVRSIVRQHGGTVDVESSPGQGSVFTVKIPAGSKEALAS